MTFKNELLRIDNYMRLLRKQPGVEITNEKLKQIKNEFEGIKTVLQINQNRCDAFQHVTFHCREALRLYTSISLQDIKSGLQNPYAKFHERQLSSMYQILKNGLSEIIITINRKNNLHAHIKTKRELAALSP